jgi:hypothetical protein
VNAPFYDAATSRMFLPPIFASAASWRTPRRFCSFPSLYRKPYRRYFDQSDEGAGKHTLKAGFYRMHGYKPQNRGGPSATGGTTATRWPSRGA